MLAVEQLASQVSRIAGRFYREPGNELTVVGVTGTNGKTSCTQFLARALSPTLHCGVIGTLGSGFPDQLEPGTHTTPDPVRLQAELAFLRDSGAAAVAMEVSSHALHQGRVAGVSFDVAVLTNLSRDHLDYHGSMVEYGLAKKQLFLMPGLKCAVLNLDDPLGQSLLGELPETVLAVAYGQYVEADMFRGAHRWVRATEVSSSQSGMTLSIDSSWGKGSFSTPLLGRFNVSNLLAVLSVLLFLGVTFAIALARLAALMTVPGRMEHFGGVDRPLVVVDYAHTPDALGHVLTALREHVTGQLICVFGCGGDRDRGKRPEMAAMAEALASEVFITDDNPRTEDGDRIVEDILTGMKRPDRARVIRDRAQAIAQAIGHAVPGDLVLVAGKGHETSQQIGDLKLPFEDREQVQQALERWRG